MSDRKISQCPACGFSFPGTMREKEPVPKSVEGVIRFFLKFVEREYSWNLAEEITQYENGDNSHRNLMDTEVDEAIAQFLGTRPISKDVIDDI